MSDRDQPAARLTAVRRKMRAAGVDLLVLGPGSHMRWLLGFAPHPDERPCLLLLAPEAAAFLAPALNAEDMAARTHITLYRWADGDGPEQALAQALAHVDADTVQHVAVDETARADHALLALDALPGARRTFAQALIGELRAVKSEEEHAALMASARINDGAMQAAFAAVAPGVSEREILAVVNRYYLDHGARSAFGIIGGGPNGGYPHHATGSRALAEGDPVVIDIGGIHRGFPSDMTRMAVAGTPSSDYLEAHAVVEKAVQAALAVAKPGVRAREVDAAARGVISQAGYGAYFTSRTGHGLGLDVHEMPFLSASSETLLEEGMVFSIEPGIYIPGRFGVRLEEIVYLRADGPEIFSTLPRDLHRAG